MLNSQDGETMGDEQFVVSALVEGGVSIGRVDGDDGDE